MTDFINVIENNARRNPNKIVIFDALNDTGLTYKQFDYLSGKVYHYLVKKGIKKEDFVAVALPRGLRPIVAMWGILKAGAAFVVLEHDGAPDRNNLIINDCRCKMVIDCEIWDEILSFEYLEGHCPFDEHAAAFALYTSGSTGVPKGIIHEFGNINLINDSVRYQDTQIIDEDDSFALMSPLGFMAGIAMAIVVIIRGATLHILPYTLVKNPSTLSQYLFEKQITLNFLSPTLYKTFKDTSPYIKTILLGGEPINNIYDDKVRLLSAYSMSECGIMLAAFEIDKPYEKTPIGKPQFDFPVYLLDENGNEVPDGVPGEICVFTSHVRGYINTTEPNNNFGPDRLYHTGDIAKKLPDGNYILLGRSNDMVKINGNRVELGEIENVISHIEGIIHCSVIVRMDESRRHFICAFYTGKELSAREFRKILGKKLPKYMVPHIFTRLDIMPMTSNGKTDKKSLPQIDLHNITTKTEYLAPSTNEEIVLTTAIEEVLENKKVSMLDNFLDLGGDSLMAIELISELESHNYTVDIKAIFESLDIQELATKLVANNTAKETVVYDNAIPATSAQMSVYTVQKINSNTVIYNNPYILTAESIDAKRLEMAVNKLIARHESLRTHFESRNNEIVQVINETVKFSLEYLDSDKPADFIRPFDLSKAPLFRVGIYENSIMVDIHHIIADGSSCAIFFKELNELYMGRELKPVVQYAEYAVTHSYTEEDEKYWLNEFDEVPTLDLITDYNRPEVQSISGASVFTEVDSVLNKNILDKCKEMAITPYAYYMACYNILLSKFSGNEDICVGTPSSGRSGKHLNVIGMFVNMLPVRSQPDGMKTFEEYAIEVKSKSIEAIRHQNYSQQELIKKTNYKKTLYDVMFAYQSEDMINIVLGDKNAEVLLEMPPFAKCDLSFYVVPTKNNAVLHVEYCTDLFEKETIDKFINAYMYVLSQSLNENTLIKDISVLTPKERGKLLNEFNNI